MIRRFGLCIPILLASFFSVPVYSEPYNANFPIDTQLNIVSFDTENGAPNSNTILAAVNKARSNIGAPPLRPNQKLAAVAASRAKDMVSKQYYAHKNPDGKLYYENFNSLGIDPDYSCENLDLTQSIEATTAVDDWTASAKGHKQCLLNPNVVEAGYATAKYSTVNINGEAQQLYLIVAIHSTQIKQ